MSASMLDFNMTTMIDTSELRVMVKGQLGKGRFWCSPSIRIIAISEQSMMTHAIISFHQYATNESLRKCLNTPLVEGVAIGVVGRVCAGSSFSLKLPTIFDVACSAGLLVSTASIVSTVPDQ
jgi:hypothetical protein